MSTNLELSNNKKPLLLRKLHKHGNYYSIGLPQSIKTRMKIDENEDSYFKVWYSDELNGIVYQFLEESGH
jgi:hypothetical protein